MDEAAAYDELTRLRIDEKAARDAIGNSIAQELGPAKRHRWDRGRSSATSLPAVITSGSIGFVGLAPLGARSGRFITLAAVAQINLTGPLPAGQLHARPGGPTEGGNGQP